jgi:hypothetical protein
MSKILRLTLVTCLFVAASALTTFAQSTVTGGIGGSVTDPNGAVVPNASVTSRNIETNKEDTATTDHEGRYRIVNLQPGTYTVTINGQGFGAYTQEKIVVEVGRITEIGAQLSVGPQSANDVTVSGEAPVINTNQQDFSNNVNQTSINNLPVNGRRWSNFALLTPGATPDGVFGLVSFRGISSLLNNNTVDGADNNQAFFGEERGRTRLSYSTSQAAIREFQVNTSNFSAEYGRAAGAVVNAVTKSGTNEFHGSGFLYDRNNKWGARNPLATQTTFDPATGAINVIGIKPKDARYQFGGTIGGPIIKDKLFFFFSYDQQKRNFPGLSILRSNYLSSANTAAALGTTLSAQQLFDRSLKNPLRNLSDAQINSVLTFLNSETGPVNRRGDQTIYFPKIDWQINPNNVLTANYNRLRWNSPGGFQTQPTNFIGRASFGDDLVNIDTLIVRLASTLGPNIVNEARFQASRDFERALLTGSLPGEPTTSINGAVPNITLTNGLDFGQSSNFQRRAFPDEKRQQYADTVTWTKGIHTVKFGGDFNHVFDLEDNLRSEAGSFTYSNINDFIIDYLKFQNPTLNIPCSATNNTRTVLNGSVPVATRFAGKCYTSNFSQAFGQSRFEFRTNDYNFFVQDDIRVSPRLTVNLGMRYEYQQNPDPQIPNPAVPQTSQMPSDKNNFGPRFGFAYAATNDGKTSIRGGYGIYYGRILNSTIVNAISNTGMPGGQFTASVLPANGPVFPNVLTSGAASGAPSIQFFDTNYQAPNVHQVDIVFEREIAHNTMFSVSGLFSLGRHLPDFVDLNLSAPTGSKVLSYTGGPLDGQKITIPVYTGARPNTAFRSMTAITSDIKSEYDALVLQLNRRLTNGLQVQASYTRSRARDTGQTSTTFTAFNIPLDVFDRSTESGISSFDIPNKFVVSAVYNTHGLDIGSGKIGRNLFNGFTIAPIFLWQSGSPYSGSYSGSFFPSGFTVAETSSVNGSGGASRVIGLPRNGFRQNRIVNTDLRISRRFKLGETANVEVLGEAFNLFNRTQVTGVNTTLYNAGNSTAQTLNLNFNAGNFGSTTAAGGTVYQQRQIQLAVRFEF